MFCRIFLSTGNDEFILSSYFYGNGNTSITEHRNSSLLCFQFSLGENDGRMDIATFTRSLFLLMRKRQREISLKTVNLSKARRKLLMAPITTAPKMDSRCLTYLLLTSAFAPYFPYVLLWIISNSIFSLTNQSARNVVAYPIFWLALGIVVISYSFRRRFARTRFVRRAFVSVDDYKANSFAFKSNSRREISS